jgi:hypothetical protein
MKVSAFELDVMVSGRSIREYGHQGRTYVEGRKGSPFTLRFRNNSPNRVLAIPSVDGLSVLDGQTATGDSRGYVVPAYSSVEIRGWRVSLDQSSDFVFTERQASYAGQTGGEQNIGVIGVKVIGEVYRPPVVIHHTPPVEHHHHHYHDGLVGGGLLRSRDMTAGDPTFGGTTTCESATLGVYTCSMATGEVSAQAPAQSLSAPDFNLGIGWGASKVDQVSEVAFERGVELATLEIHYSDAAGLAAAGIALTKDLAVETRSMPRSFGGFCSPPRKVLTRS